MNDIYTIVIDKIKSFCKVMFVFFVVIAVLVLFKFCIELIFSDILSLTSMAVLFNFIVFAGIIYFVMRQAVHPKAILEQMQTAVENEIKDSEVAKEASEEKLTAVQKSARGVKKEINAILKKSEENAQLVGAKILENAEKTAIVVQENAEKAIENSQVLLKNDLIRRASLASVEVAKSHILNELNVNSELHDKLIDESIEALVIDKKEEVEEV